MDKTSNSKTELGKRSNTMQEQVAKLDEDQSRHGEYASNSIHTIEAWQGETIKLNVGGRIFETTATTLRRFPGSLFDEILGATNQKNLIKRDDGTLFLDRCPEYFNYILNWLRNPDSQLLQPYDELGRKMLEMEVKFYKLSQLLNKPPE